jgi:hypothetical protein
MPGQEEQKTKTQGKNTLISPKREGGKLEKRQTINEKYQFASSTQR